LDTISIGFIDNPKAESYNFFKKSKEPCPQGGALKTKFSRPKIEIPKSLDPEFDRP
jgi:hypothetical protein